MSPSDCEHALRQLWSFLDGELSEVEFREIQVHLEECISCGSRVEFQRRLRTVIRMKCHGEPVPADLRRRLFNLLERDPE